LPQGNAYYDRCLQSIPTTTLTADSIHSLGEREVAALQGEMRRILTAHGYPDRDLAATIRSVFAEPRFGFAPGDSGRAQILSTYQDILDDARERVKPLFGIQPKARLEVVRVPAFKEATSAGAYYQPPSIGGKRPGQFF